MTTPNSHEHLARLIAIAVSDKLAEFSANIPLPEAEQTALKWVVDMAESHPESLEHISDSAEAIQALGDNIAFTILTNIAEERPGTNPWEHERKVPLPLSLAFSQLRLLAAITQTALFNNDYRWAENSNANNLALTGILSEPKINKSEAMERLVLVPQPAMAYIARFMRNTYKKIESKEWLVSSQTLASPDEFPGLLLRHAHILSKLTSTFGRPVDPQN
jgi:hypothetical protein